MPKITFIEKDLTSPGILNVTANTVYVPGFSVSGPVNKPTLLNSVQELKETFGCVADSQEEGFVKFSETFTYNGKTLFTRNQKEPGYLYAKELLASGLPVIFERLSSATNAIDGSTAYRLLHEALSSETLKDCGKYNVKFLTSGGYPNFCSNVSENITSQVFSSDYATTKSTTILDVKADRTDSAVKRLSTSNLEYSKVCKDSYVDTYTATNNKTGPFGIHLNNISISDLDKFMFAVYTNAKFLRKIGNYPGTTHSWDLNDCWVNVKAERVTNPCYDNTWKVQIFGLNYKDANTVKVTVSTVDTANTADPTIVDNTTVLLYTLENIHADTLDELLKDFYFVDDPATATEISVYSSQVIKLLESDTTNINSSINAISTDLHRLANLRKDCVALIDHTPDILPENLLACVDLAKANFGEYDAMFTPWGSYQVSGEDFNMPASFGYLLALARSTSNNPNWLAVAGAARGGVPNLIALNETVTNAVAESYQQRMGVSINPITEITPYGNLIWGNRTLKNNEINLTAKSFLNIRVLICDVVKTAFAAARAMTFEQNNDILWVNFKSMLISTLDQMVKGAGISAYELKKRANKQKAELRCVIRLYAIEAVEDFEIELQLADETSAVIA